MREEEEAHDDDCSLPKLLTVLHHWFYSGTKSQFFASLCRIGDDDDDDRVESTSSKLCFPLLLLQCLRQSLNNILHSVFAEAVERAAKQTALCVWIPLLPLGVQPRLMEHYRN